MMRLLNSTTTRKLGHRYSNYAPSYLDIWYKLDPHHRTTLGAIVWTIISPLAHLKTNSIDCLGIRRQQLCALREVELRCRETTLTWIYDSGEIWSGEVFKDMYQNVSLGMAGTCRVSRKPGPVRILTLHDLPRVEDMRPVCGCHLSCSRKGGWKQLGRILRMKKMSKY